MRRVLVAGLLLAGCGEGAGECVESLPGETDAGGPPQAGGPVSECDANGAEACVASFDPADDASFGHDRMPDVVLGPPHGDPAGGVDVAALGCGGTITLYFPDGIADGPGADFIVFENAFAVGNETFAEPAFVGVSADGLDFRWFPCATDGSGGWPPVGCAGVSEVYSSPDNEIDARDPEAAGGDAFDLADVGLCGANFVRIVDVTEQYYGNVIWCGGEAGGFDLDAVSVVHEAAP